MQQQFEQPTAQKITPNIVDIDEKVALLVNRLDMISNHIKAGIFGESPHPLEAVCANDIPTPSLTSIVRRLEMATSTIIDIETNIKILHQ